MEEGAAYLSPPKLKMRDSVVWILKSSDDVFFVQIKDVIHPMFLKAAPVFSLPSISAASVEKAHCFASDLFENDLVISGRLVRLMRTRQVTLPVRGEVRLSIVAMRCVTPRR